MRAGMITIHPHRPRFWFKRIGFVIIALITLALLAIAIENYRARRAWETCKLRFEQKGETLDWQSLLTNPGPDDQNMLAAPVLAPCFGFGTGPDGAKRDKSDTNACQQLAHRFDPVSKIPVQSGDWRRASPMSLSESLSQVPQTNLQQLRLLLRQNRDILDEIRDAARRPFAQLTLSQDTAWDNLEPMFAQLKTIRSVAIALHASCQLELVDGKAEAACSEIETMLALAEAAGSQPLLIGLLVKMAMIETSCQPLWAGLAEHRWPDAQLARLEARLNQINVVADYRRCLRGERAFALARVGSYPHVGVARSDKIKDQDSPPSQEPAWQVFRLWPRAFTYRNQINLANGFQAFFFDRLDPAGPSVKLAAVYKNDPSLSKLRSSSPYNLFFPKLFPAIEKTMAKAAASQATVSLARVACALERYRLLTGRYPQSLADLAPRFIARVPPDPVNGGQLKYSLIDSGRFILYSIGPDGTDDAGKPIAKAGRTDEERGDWVWRDDLTARNH